MNKAERLLKDGAVGEPFLFYGASDWGSNFSRHVIILPNPFTGELTRYKTGEHRYQAMKASNLIDHQFVVATSTPFNSKLAGRKIELREGWGNNVGDLCWYVMREVVLTKALQHSDVRYALIKTGDHHIYEDSPTDDIWGWRFEESYNGKNLLGRCWMETRALLFAAKAARL